MSGNVKVVARFRPPNALELREGGDIVVGFSAAAPGDFDDPHSQQQQAGEETVKILPAAGAQGADAQNGFTFDRVFPMGARQSDVFEYGIRETVDGASAGSASLDQIFLLNERADAAPFPHTGPRHRCHQRIQWHHLCLRADRFGQDVHDDGELVEDASLRLLTECVALLTHFVLLAAGLGQQGSDIDNTELKGVIPRITERIITAINTVPENMQFTLRVNYMEIYMEKIRDLLAREWIDCAVLRIA